MLTLHNTEYKGRKQKVGSPLFTNSGKLCFFICYCPDCKAKCVVTLDEANKLMRMFAREKHHLKQRIAVKLLKKYSY